MPSPTNMVLDQWVCYHKVLLFSIPLLMDRFLSAMGGGVENGQGLHTKMVQVVSHELGIPMDKIRVSKSAYDKVPNPTQTGGSATADLFGNALKDVCDQINKRLAPVREAKPGGLWGMI